MHSLFKGLKNRMWDQFLLQDTHYTFLCSPHKQSKKAETSKNREIAYKPATIESYVSGAVSIRFLLHPNKQTNRPARQKIPKIHQCALWSRDCYPTSHHLIYDIALSRWLCTLPQQRFTISQWPKNWIWFKIA